MLKAQKSLEQKIYPVIDETSFLPIPFYMEKVSAGFPSPAEGYMDKALDLNELMIEKPAATFFVRVEGESMTGVGIFPGDMLIVNNAKKPIEGKIIVAVIDGEITVKRLRILKNKMIKLEPENPNYQPIYINPEQDFKIWGVVTGVVRNM